MILRSTLPHRYIPRRNWLLATTLICTFFIVYSCKDISTANYTNIRVNVTPNADKSRVVTEIKYITKTQWVAANAEATAGIPLEEGFQDTQPAQRLPLENHKYQPNGLLEVNPNGPHPIFELIRTAEAAWDNKLAKASKTLGEAVTEYKRRYKRAPPKGFDAWWDYVQKHNVLLPDDYDQINEDLLPFWGMDPEDVRRTQFEWEGHSDSYTVGKTSSSAIHVVNYSLPGNEHSGHDLLGGAYEVMELLKDVEEHIPPFRAVFSPHDNPDLPTDWELKRMALDHAEAGTYLDFNDPPPVKLNGWVAACPPDSPAILTPISWDLPAPPPPTQPKTFIHTHKPAMDPCLHPSLFLQSGQFLSHKQGPVPHRFMPPQFSYSSTMVHHDIRPAMLLSFVDDVPKEARIAWEEKTDDRLQWRGSNTGMWHGSKTRWREAQRSRAVAWAGVKGGVGVDEDGMVKILKAEKEDLRVGEGQNITWARWAPAALDVAFAHPNGAGSCAPDTCKEVEKLFEWRRPMSVKEAAGYKYVFDVDGNGWSSRFKRLISSNTVVFKATIYPEWFTERIAPWVHYVPVQMDLSDLADALTFFRGDLNGDGAHDDMAKKIAAAGREWSLSFWRREDLTAYMFRLFLEYARVTSVYRDRPDMSFQFQRDERDLKKRVERDANIE